VDKIDENSYDFLDRENHQPVVSDWHTLSHSVVSGTHSVSGDRY
jgi:hypothetical protein